MLEHVAFEGPGSVAAWVMARGHQLTASRLFAGEPLPDPESFDALLVLGGPMSVTDEDRHSWLVPEKRFLAAALRREQPILGICLGAQLLADVLGARVRPSPEPEVGWFPIELMPAGRASPWLRDLPPRFEAFHWHGESFDVPAGAVHVASSRACPTQAFVYGDRALAIQFHLETTPEIAEALLAYDAADRPRGPFVQTPEAVRAEPARFAALHARMERVLDAFARLVHPPHPGLSSPEF